MCLCAAGDFIETPGRNTGIWRNVHNTVNEGVQDTDPPFLLLFEFWL